MGEYKTLANGTSPNPAVDLISQVPGIYNGSTKRVADGRTYSEHSRSPSYSRIELGLRTKYCAFWSGRTGGAMVEIYSLSRFVTA